MTEEYNYFSIATSRDDNLYKFFKHIDTFDREELRVMNTILTILKQDTETINKIQDKIKNKLEYFRQRESY